MRSQPRVLNYAENDHVEGLPNQVVQDGYEFFARRQLVTLFPFLWNVGVIFNLSCSKSAWVRTEGSLFVMTETFHSEVAYYGGCMKCQ